MPNCPKFIIFAMWQAAERVTPEKTYLGGDVHESANLAQNTNDHQILSKIAPCTPVFTKFEPRIGKSTTPQMDNWRPKTMRRAPKSGVFRPSARPFFHQKRGWIALWIHWRTLQLIEYHYFNLLRLSSCRLVILSKSKWKSSQKLLINIYIY